MSDDWGGQHQGTGDGIRLWSGQEDEHGDKAFEQITDKGEYTAPEAAVLEGVCGAGVVVVAPFYEVWLVENPGEYLGIQHATR